METRALYRGHAAPSEVLQEERGAPRSSAGKWLSEEARFDCSHGAGQRAFAFPRLAKRAVDMDERTQSQRHFSSRVFSTW